MKKCRRKRNEKTCCTNSFISLSTKPSNSDGGVETAVEAPRWEDYVPAKYQNPRDDFRRGSAIAEMVVGIVLTDLLITAPIGIPLICHSTTKLKNISYSEKKEFFEEGLKLAETIKDNEEKQKYYKKLLKKCRFSEAKKKKLAKKNAKAKEKAQKELEKIQQEEKN